MLSAVYNEKAAWVGREFYGCDSLISILGSPSAPGMRLVGHSSSGSFLASFLGPWVILGGVGNPRLRQDTVGAQLHARDFAQGTP